MKPGTAPPLDWPPVSWKMFQWCLNRRCALDYLWLRRLYNDRTDMSTPMGLEMKWRDD